MPVTNGEFVQSQGKDLPLLLTTDDCRGKTFIITGGYSGIGYETAKHLINLQSARVILAVRDLKRGEEAKRTLEELTAKTSVVQVYELDLSSLKSVKAFVDKVTADLDRIDGLIANAAIGLTDWRESEGYETQLTVNLISNVLLMALIMPFLRETGKKLGTVPRIVFLGTIATFLTPKPLLALVTGDDVLNDLNDREKWQSSINDRYPQTKLLLHLAVRHLAEILPASEAGVVVNVADPGLCRTSWSRNMSFWVRLVARFANYFVGRYPEMGSRSVLAALKLDNSHGKFVSDAEIADYKMSEWITEEEGKVRQEKTWASLTNLLNKIQPGCLDWCPPAKGL